MNETDEVNSEKSKTAVSTSETSVKSCQIVMKSYKRLSYRKFNFSRVSIQVSNSSVAGEPWAISR
jgi:hypothetical protein